jgi:hypothetical protein
MVVAHQSGEECSYFRFPIADWRFEEVRLNGSIGNWQSEIGNEITERMKGSRKA